MSHQMYVLGRGEQTKYLVDELIADGNALKQPTPATAALCKDHPRWQRAKVN